MQGVMIPIILQCFKGQNLQLLYLLDLPTHGSNLNVQISHTCISNFLKRQIKISCFEFRCPSLCTFQYIEKNYKHNFWGFCWSTTLPLLFFALHFQNWHLVEIMKGWQSVPASEVGIKPSTFMWWLSHSAMSSLFLTNTQNNLEKNKFEVRPWMYVSSIWLTLQAVRCTQWIKARHIYYTAAPQTPATCLFSSRLASCHQNQN